MPSCFSIPPQSHFVRQLPRRRWRLLVQYKHGVQCRTPSRSDRFNGVTGVARGPKGRNRNLPWPPGKKVIKLLAVLFACFTPSGCSFHSHPHPSTGRLFSIAKLRMCFPNIPRIIANMLKLTSISCFSIVMPIYIDNLMIMGYLITMRRKTPHR